MYDDIDPTQNERLSDMLPEVSPERAATYETRDPERTYEVICGDDRTLAEESAEALARNGEAPVEAFIRYYGGLSGVTRVLTTTLFAQGRDDLVEHYFGGSFVDAAKKIKIDAEAANENVSLDLHTATSNEEELGHFNVASKQEPGCKYAANVATLGTLCAENKDLEALTYREGAAMGSTDSTVSIVRQANEAFVSRFFSSDTAGMSREDFASIGAPVAILEGDHVAPEETVAVINFTHDQVSNPKEAKKIGKPFYNNDVTQIAEMLIRAYPEFGLDPEIMFAVMDQDIRATRAALAGGDATAIKQERLGDPQEAIAYLKELQDSLA